MKSMAVTVLFHPGEVTRQGGIKDEGEGRAEIWKNNGPVRGYRCFYGLGRKRNQRGQEGPAGGKGGQGGGGGAHKGKFIR